MKKFLIALLVILSFAAFAGAANFDKEYTCRVGKMWGFPGEKVTFRISDTNLAEIIRRNDGEFCIRPKKAGDFAVEATFKNSDGSTTTKIFLLHAVEETFSADNFDREYTCNVGKLWGFPGEKVTFRISDTSLAEIIRRSDGQFCIRPKKAGDFTVEAIFRNSDGSTTTKIFLLHAVEETFSADNFDREYTCNVGKLWGFPGEKVTFRISDTNLAEIIRRSDGQFCIRPKKAGDFTVEATFRNSDGSTTTKIFLLHAVEENLNADNFDREYTCNVGKLWGFPGEKVTFRISDTNLAEIIRRSDGQFCIRPKKAGDFTVEATFRNFDGTTTTQIYLLHAVDESLNNFLETDYAEKVLMLVNLEREKNNLQPLTLAKDLSDCARIRANETVRVFSHTRPDGQSFNTVAEKGSYKKIGENINGGAKSAAQVVYEWMHSPAHRENILYPNYNEMGVACVYAADSKYKYYWVQWFRLR